MKTMKKMINMLDCLILSLALVLMFVLPDSVLGKDRGHIELKCVAEMEEEVINNEGEKEIRRIEAAKVVPGDTVIYTISYTVIGNETVNDVVIDNPIPENMVYEDKSAYGYNTDIIFSIDGGKTFTEQSNLKFVDVEGIEQLASAEDYTHIRWIFKDPISPGKTGWVSYRAQLK